LGGRAGQERADRRPGARLSSERQSLDTSGGCTANPSQSMYLLLGITVPALVTPPLLSRFPSTRARSAVVARDLAFVAQLEVATDPFEAGAKPVGGWFEQAEALQILMSQAESSRRLDGGDGASTAQRWEVTTPIQFPGMVVRSETQMDVQVDAAAPRLRISSGASKTVCEGGPRWAQGLLSRIGEIATTSSSNVIELRDAPGGRQACVSTVNLTVKLSIPAILLPPFVPAGPFEKTGSASIQALLDRDMAPVMARFREGYIAWAASP